jgi:hypothetical protein
MINKYIKINKKPEKNTSSPTKISVTYGVKPIKNKELILKTEKKVESFNILEDSKKLELLKFFRDQDHSVKQKRMTDIQHFINNNKMFWWICQSICLFVSPTILSVNAKNSRQKKLWVIGTMITSFILIISTSLIATSLALSSGNKSFIANITSFGINTAIKFITYCFIGLNIRHIIDQEKNRKYYLALIFAIFILSNILVSFNSTSQNFLDELSPLQGLTGLTDN